MRKERITKRDEERERTGFRRDREPQPQPGTYAQCRAGDEKSVKASPETSSLAHLAGEDAGSPEPGCLLDGGPGIKNTSSEAK